MNFVRTGMFAVVVAVTLPSADGDEPRPNATLLSDAQKVFEPLPPAATKNASGDNPVIELGRKLFFDPRISVDGTVSCSRCHQPALYAIDGLTVSHGAHDKLLPRNAPTVFNVALNFRQHWRGEFATVEDQARHALTASGFGNPDEAAAMSKVHAIPGYLDLFKNAFPGEIDPVTPENWGKAVGAYERTLSTPSRFDDFLRGNVNALTTEERRGLRTFIDVGCADCHGGAGVGGRSFEKFGVAADYWTKMRSKSIDKGRWDVTKNPDDLYVFKVPGLRNVAMTAPYFHDGSVDFLPSAVAIMAKLQLDLDLRQTDVDAITAFLGSLTGVMPPEFQAAPLLPAGAVHASSPLPGKSPPVP